MKQLLTVLAIISAISATILAVFPKFNIAVFPAILALASGYAALYLSKKENDLKKIVPFTLYLSGITLCLITFKFIWTFTTTPPQDVSNTAAVDETSVTKDNKSD
jgi:multisubunit Na+/H+ antiporter MnhC subunit